MYESKSPDLLYLDESFCVVRKPAGLLSQKSSKSDESLLEALRQNRHLKNQKLHLLHRLDRNTSGLMVLATEEKAAADLSEQIKNKALIRRYFCIVKGKTPEAGVIDAKLLKDPKNNTVEISQQGKSAVTVYRRLTTVKNFSLLDVELKTGRSHQIRVHMASINHNLIGDKKYTKGVWSKLLERPALHSYRIQLTHPFTKNRFVFVDRMPDDMRSLLI